MGEADDEVVLIAGTPEWIDEAALVLASQGIASSAEPSADGLQLRVARGDELRAHEVLRAYAEDQAESARRSSVVPSVTRWDGRLAAWIAIALTELYWLTGPLDSPHGRWFSRGECGWSVLKSEPWRAVTALTLHSDSAHLLSNLLFGLLFVGAVGARFGRGLGLVLVLLGGVAGNVASSAWLGDDQLLLGWSTAVFAAMGITGGALAAERAGLGRWARPWTPLGLAVCFLAYLGSDPGTAISAHLFGTLAGLLLGAACGLLAPAPPAPWLQRVLAAAAASAVAACWWLALR